MYKCSKCDTKDLAPDEYSCYECYTCINCGGCNCEQPPEPDPTEEQQWTDDNFGQQRL